MHFVIFSSKRGSAWTFPFILWLCCDFVYARNSPWVRRKRQGILFGQETPDMRNTFSESLGTCQSPAKFSSDASSPGECVPITVCPDLLKFLKGPERDINYLRRTICRIITATPYVCCPVKSVPPTEAPVNKNEELQVLSSERSLFPNPDTFECGTFVTDRIVGGKNAARDQWPWIALLYYDVKGQGLKHGCGGSLITKRYVLTAAHCIDDTGSAKLVTVRLGEYDLRTNPDCDDNEGKVKRTCTAFLDVEVEKIVVHPDYTQHRFKGAKNDIALVRLKQEIDFATHDNILPVCLPFNPADVDGSGDTSLPGKTAKVAGWGRISVEFRNNGSDILQELAVPIISAAKCRETPAFKRVEFGVEHLCAGGEKGKDSCKGDSGGPLILPGGKGRSLIYQVGVVSFGTPYCGLIEAPGVYTRVSSYTEWIKENVEP